MENYDVSQYWPVSTSKGAVKRAEAIMCKYPEFRAIWVISEIGEHVLFQVDKFGKAVTEAHVMENEEKATEVFIYWAFNVSL